MSGINLIFGPPGTGKTTKLLSIVEEKIREGLSPSDICYVGFTRRAAREAKERAIEKFSLEPEQFPWFRTLHSLAFALLDLNKNAVMGIGDYIKLCNRIGLTITVSGINNEEGTFAPLTKGDRLFFAESMARAKMMELEEYWKSVPDEDIYYYELLQLREALEEYKKANGKMDFTDIIYGFIDDESVLTPPCKVLIVDEAQDLSPLQWRMVDKLATGIDEVYIAGDDDQAIFRWAGADIEHLISMPGNRTVLTQSYRVPKKIQEVANQIVDRINIRVEKHWKPREAEGSVEYAATIDEIDMSSGQWLLLARNSYLTEYYISKCLREGFLYVANKRANDPLNPSTARAIQTWQQLAFGLTVRGEEVKAMVDLMNSKVGVAYGFKTKIADLRDYDQFDLVSLRKNYGIIPDVDKTWDIALDKISDTEREYFLAAARRGEELDLPPRIRISTIHGAKGAEADNVVINLDMAERTFREMEKFEDDEHRVWYTAVTRARERLIVVQPQTNKCYTL